MSIVAGTLSSPTRFSEAGTYRVKAIIYSGFPPSSKSVTVTVPDEPFTVNILPVTGCMVLAGDGGVDDAEPNGNGIVCSGGMATNNPLCTEQFQKSQVASLKVVPEPGHVFTGWTVNGAQINASVEPLFLTTMPLLAQTGERITPITGNTADCQANCASIEIVSADITQNHIQIRLEPEGTVGDLTLELRDPDSYVILENQPRTGSEDALNESFNLDNWDEEAIGRYTRLRATWTVNDVEIQDELVFSEGMQLDVLGGYEHTQYQAISEQDFNGNATAACLVIDNQCTYQQITLRSDFLEEVIENTGHGTSIEHGRLQWGTWCANNGYPPPAACAPTGELVRTLVAVETYIGSCGSPVIPGTTVAVGLDGNDLSPENPDNLRCDERLFIYHPDYPELQVIKTITDRCPDCANERHVDNYVDESADAFTYPDDPMTIRLY